MATEQDIFDSEIDAEEAVKPTEVSETAPEAEREEPAAKQPPPGEKEPPAADSAAPRQDQPLHQVPLSELLNTRERAQKAESELSQLKRAFDEFQRQQQPKEAPKPPDQFADPEGYNAFWKEQLGNLRQTLEGTVQGQLYKLSAQNSWRWAVKDHGRELVQEAQKAFGELQHTQPLLAEQIAQSEDPFEGMVAWFKQQKTITEIGTDPAAYRQKILDEALNDEAFLGKVVERIQGKSGGANPRSNPSNVTRLPPSLTRATSAQSAHDADDGDDSEEGIFAAGR